MIGAIIGDIVGSPYEFHNINVKNFPLFSHASRFTDDTVLTIALADCIMNEKDWIDTIHEYFERYIKCGFGGQFISWATNKCRDPYNSWGNGSAMRVSPIAWLYEGYDVMRMARKSARVTHSNIEGIKGAEAIAMCIYLAKKGWKKANIKAYVENCYYEHIPTLEEIEIIYDNYLMNNRSLLYSCQGSVPQAIRCFLEGKDFEDVIRTSVSIGGDSDTIACMAGSIAEAYYGVPDKFIIQALRHLDPELRDIVYQFNSEAKS